MENPTTWTPLDHKVNDLIASSNNRLQAADAIAKALGVDKTKVLQEILSFDARSKRGVIGGSLAVCLVNKFKP